MPWERLGGEKVITPLVYCAGRPEVDIRAAAVEILGRLAYPSTLPTLLERLNDQNTAIQGRAITALSNFPASSSLCDRLRPFLKANDGDLDAEAALALAKLKDRSVDGRHYLPARLTACINPQGGRHGPEPASDLVDSADDKLAHIDIFQERVNHCHNLRIM